MRGGTADQTLFERAEMSGGGYSMKPSDRLHGAALIGWDQPFFFALRVFTALADFPREIEPAGMIRSRTR